MDKLIKLQIALFFFEIETRPDRLISVVNDNLGNLFDAMPSIFPIPQEAPPEIPIVTLSDSNQRFSCSIARSRIDFSRVISAGEQLDETDKVITDFQKKANLFVAAVSQAKKVVRFGFIAQYFFTIFTCNIDTFDPFYNLLWSKALIRFANQHLQKIKK